VTAEVFADLVRARRVGAGRWLARCPAHDDRNPSLSIGTGQDGRVLLRCWPGCRTHDILAALGLKLKDLFPSSSPPSAAEIAKAAREDEVEAERNREQRAVERERDDRTRRREAVICELGKRLRLTPDGSPQQDALTRLYHETLGQLSDRQISDRELFDAMTPEENSPVRSGAIGDVN
jgi:hypothetical protein